MTLYFQKIYLCYLSSNKRKRGIVYSDKFHLNVIDLTHIEHATEADKEYQLVAWANFFTATTWEEVIMLAKNNPIIDEAAQTLYEANADRITEDICRARRNYYKQQNTTEKLFNDVISERDTAIAERDTAILERDSAIAERDKAISRIAELEAKLAKQKHNK